MMTFETWLRDGLASKKKLSMRDKRIKMVLDSKPSERRARILDRWENAARGAAGIEPTAGAIDWSKIDWAKILEVVLAILAKFLVIAL